MKPVRTVDVIFINNDTIKIIFKKDWFWKSEKSVREYILLENKNSYGSRNLTLVLNKSTHSETIPSHFIGERIGRRSWGVYTKDILGGTRYSFHPLNVTEDERDLFLLGRTNGKKVV